MRNLQALLNVSDLTKITKTTTKTMTTKTETTETTQKRPISFVHGNIDDAKTLNPFTHIYMCDVAFPESLMTSIASKFNASRYVQFLVSFRTPKRIIHDFGFHVDFLEKQIQCRLHGSNEKHTAYFYRAKRINDDRDDRDNRDDRDDRDNRDNRDNENHKDNKDNKLFCDRLFLESCKLALGPPEILKTFVDDQVNKFLNSGRPKRKRSVEHVEHTEHFEHIKKKRR